MTLVDTLQEQALLEQVLDASKPRVPRECEHLHYLLSTPFRYLPPSPTGSRFRRAGFTAGVFYASLLPETAVAEMAFRRLLFYAESPATPWPSNAGDYTAFAVRFTAGKGVDLTRPPFDRDAHLWTDPADYSACQVLAETARTVGVIAIRYQSARAAGQNVALLSCAAFASKAPLEWQSWRIHIGPMGVRAICNFPEQRLAFDRAAFAHDPRIAAMAWKR